MFKFISFLGFATIVTTMVVIASGRRNGDRSSSSSSSSDSSDENSNNNYIYNLYCNMEHTPVWISNNEVLYDTQIVNKEYLNSIDNLPIVFIHGLFGTTDAWYPFLEYLFNSNNYNNKISKQSFILLSLKGRGGSQYYPDYNYTNYNEISDTWSYDTFSNEIIQVITSLGISKFHILGHAFGSLLSFYISINYPTYVESLFLVGTTTYWDDTTKITYLSFFNRDTVDAFGSFRAFAQTYLPVFLAAGGDYQYFTEDELTNRWTYALNLHLDVIDHFPQVLEYDIIDDIDILDENQIPIFILQGSNDLLTPTTRLQPLFDQLSSDQLTYVEIENAGHYLAFQSVWFDEMAQQFASFFF